MSKMEIGLTEDFPYRIMNERSFIKRHYEKRQAQLVDARRDQILEAAATVFAEKASMRRRSKMCAGS